MLLRVLLVALCVVGNGNAVLKEPYMNQLIDEIIDEMRPMIVKQNLNVLKFGNVQHDFSYGFWYLKTTGTILCEDGQVRALSTIYRTGDANGEIHFDEFTIESALGLRTLEFSFNVCRLYVKDIVSYSLPLSGSVGKNSVDLRVAVFPEEEEGLRVNLTKVELQELGQISLSTGGSPFDRLRSDVVNGLIAKFHGSIFRAVAASLEAFQNRAIQVHL